MTDVSGTRYLGLAIGPHSSLILRTLEYKIGHTSSPTEMSEMDTINTVDIEPVLPLTLTFSLPLKGFSSSAPFLLLLTQHTTFLASSEKVDEKIEDTKDVRTHTQPLAYRTWRGRSIVDWVRLLTRNLARDLASSLALSVCCRPATHLGPRLEETSTPCTVDVDN